MPISKAQQKSVHKYVKEHYDRISVTVPQGKRDIIKQAGEALGLSVNGFINAAVDEKLERDNRNHKNAGG